jgi:hypothetical protein
MSTRAQRPTGLTLWQASRPVNHEQHPKQDGAKCAKRVRPPRSLWKEDTEDAAGAQQARVGSDVVNVEGPSLSKPLEAPAHSAVVEVVRHMY